MSDQPEEGDMYIIAHSEYKIRWSLKNCCDLDRASQRVKD